jgi:5-methylcytosine-specific restriction endonuclease McrA
MVKDFMLLQETMKFELTPYHRNISEQELFDDLKKVALKLGKGKVTKEEYDEHGKFSSGTFEKRFGWTKAIKSIGLEINMHRNISDEELFKNIEEVWIKLGRQPLYVEIKQPLSKYSSKPYEKRFGTWRKALEAFVEYINSDLEQNAKEEEKNSKSVQEKQIVHKHKTKRDISERLKVQVLMRDGNKCRLCGITVTGDNIHFDHIKPWSRGGETVFENIQVLCAQHNLAKGNFELEEK